MKKLTAAGLLAALFISSIGISAAYADIAAVPISAQIEAASVDFEITESVTMSYSGNGNELTISDIVISNNKVEGINLAVDSVDVSPIMGWKVVPADTDFTNKLNKKEFSIATSTHDFSAGSYTAAGTIEEGQSMTLSFAGKAGAFSSKVSEKAANIVVTISLEDNFQIVSWADGTDAQIAAMLSAHETGKINIYDYWSVGDERNVTLSATEASYTEMDGSFEAQEVTFVLLNEGGYNLTDGTECLFVVGQKNSLTEPSIHYKPTTDYSYAWAYEDFSKWCNNEYYNSLPEGFRSIFREYTFIGFGGTDHDYVKYETYFNLPSFYSILGTGHSAGELNQFEYYTNTANRIKCLGNEGQAAAYWAFHTIPVSVKYTYIDAAGSGPNYIERANSASYGLAPIGCIGSSGTTSNLKEFTLTKATTSCPYGAFFFDEGMTWAEWTETGGNVQRYYKASGNKVTAGDDSLKWIKDSNGNTVLPTDKIVEGAIYTLYID